MGISFWMEVSCSAVAWTELSVWARTDQHWLLQNHLTAGQLCWRDVVAGCLWYLSTGPCLLHCWSQSFLMDPRVLEHWKSPLDPKTSVSCQRDMLGPEGNDSLQVPAIQIISPEDIDSSLIMQETWIEITVLCSEWEASCKAIEKPEWQVLSAVCFIVVVLSLCRLRTCLVHAMVAFQAAAQFSFFGNLKMWEGNLKKMMSSLVLFWCGTRLSVEYTYGNREKL